MFATRGRAVADRLLESPARVIVRLSISPSSVTLVGLGLIVASCVYLVITRNLLIFCGLVTVATAADALDGAVARLSGKTSRFGSYLDAVCDRYGEACVTMTVAWVTGYWVWSVVTMAGTLLISYTKARAAMEVPVSNFEWPDLMERSERDVVYVLGLAASQVLPWRPFAQDLFWWTLVLLGVLLHVTVIQRVLRARQFIRARSGSA